MKYIRYRIVIGHEPIGFGAVILLNNRETEICSKGYTDLVNKCKLYIDNYKREIKGRC